MKTINGIEFLPIEKLAEYSDPEKWFCCDIVFDPQGDRDSLSYPLRTHPVENIPPYLVLDKVSEYNNEVYFEIPQIVAYYATVHRGFTAKGVEQMKQNGADELAAEFRKLLNMGDE